MAGSGRNASTSNGSTRAKKLATAAKHGGGTTTARGRIRRWATRPQQPVWLPGMNNKQTKKSANVLGGPTSGGNKETIHIVRGPSPGVQVTCFSPMSTATSSSPEPVSASHMQTALAPTSNVPLQACLKVLLTLPVADMLRRLSHRHSHRSSQHRPARSLPSATRARTRGHSS
jgi:hypothetical protein